MTDLAQQQTEDSLWRDAKTIAQRQQSGAAALETQETELETQISELRTRLADIQLQRKSASLAPQRVAHYAPMFGGYYHG
jgi:phage shock protein A